MNFILYIVVDIENNNHSLATEAYKSYNHCIIQSRLVKLPLNYFKVSLAISGISKSSQEGL